jgi:hypothetical protein
MAENVQLLFHPDVFRVETVKNGSKFYCRYIEHFLYMWLFECPSQTVQPVLQKRDKLLMLILSPQFGPASAINTLTG